MEENKENDLSSKGDIGKDVQKLRILLNMTQEQLADALSLSRASINKIENDGTISTDIGFRLYYMTQKLSNNRYLSPYIKDSAKKLQIKLETQVLIKKDIIEYSYNPIIYPTN